MENTTKFGDIIFLQIDKAKPIQVEDPSSPNHEFGFLGSNGFVSPRLWVRFLESSADPKFCEITTVFKQNKSFDPKECMFVILPKLRYRHHMQKLKIEQNISRIGKKLESLKKNIRRKKLAAEQEVIIPIPSEQTNNYVEREFCQEMWDSQIAETDENAQQESLETILAMENQRLSQVNQNCVEEIICNKELISGIIGKPVHYSKSVCLQHFISKYFVTFSDSSEINNPRMKALLVSTLSKKCYFKFVPKLRYRNLKSPIYYNDEILIKPKKRDLNLIFVPSKIQTIDLQFFKFFMRKNLSYDNNFFSTHKCCFEKGQENEKNAFKLIFWQKEVPETCQIFPGDLVRIKNLDLNAYLQADIKYNKFQLEAEDLFLIEKDKHLMSSKECVWEINQLSDKPELLSQIVRNKGKEPGVIHGQSQQIYLKHFLLGRVLSNLNDSLVVHDKHSKNLPEVEIAKLQSKSNSLRKRLTSRASLSAFQNIALANKMAESEMPFSKFSSLSSKTVEQNKAICALDTKILKKEDWDKNDLLKKEEKWVRKVLESHNFEKLKKVPQMPNLIKNKKKFIKDRSSSSSNNEKPKKLKTSSDSENNDNSSSSLNEEGDLLKFNEHNPSIFKDFRSNSKTKIYQPDYFKKSIFKADFTNPIKNQEDLKECFLDFQSNFENIVILKENITYFIIFQSQYFSFHEKKTIASAFGKEANVRLSMNQNRVNHMKSDTGELNIENLKNFTIPNIIENSFKHKSRVLLRENDESRCNFQLEKLSKEEIHDLYFAKSLLYLLFNLRNKLYLGNFKDKIFKNRLEKISELFSQFFNQKTTNPKNPIQYSSSIKDDFDFDKQILMKEFSSIEVLTDILYLANFEFGDSNPEKQQNPSILFELSKTAIYFLKMIIKGNNQNVVYCSRWYDMLVKIIVKSARSGSPLDVEGLVFNMLKQNGNIIRSKENNSSIEKFIILTLTFRNYKHIKILRKLISHNKKLNNRNQREVTLLLLKDETRLTKFLPEINERHGRFSFKMVLLKWDDMEPNDLISENHFDIEKRNEYKFFFQSIKLLCDLCKGRNYMAIALLREKFPIQTLMGLVNYLNNNNLQLKAAFMHLLRLTHVDVFGFNAWAYKRNIKFAINENIVIREIRDLIWKVQFDNKLDNEENNYQQLGTKINQRRGQNSLHSVEGQMNIRIKSGFINELDGKIVGCNKIYDEKFRINPSNRAIAMEIFIDFIIENLNYLKKTDNFNNTNLNFLHFLKNVLQFLTFLLKAEIIEFDLVKKFYEETFLLWQLFENCKFVDFQILDKKSQLVNQPSHKIIFQIRKKFLKLFQIFLHQDLKSYFSELYQKNRRNLTKNFLIQVYCQAGDPFKRFRFIKLNQMVWFIAQLTKHEEFKTQNLRASLLVTLYQMLSPISTMSQDFDRSTFVVDNHLTIYRSVLKISYSVERIAENCEFWILSQDEKLIKIFQEVLFRIALLLIKACMAPNNSFIENFNIDYDSNDMQHLKTFLEIVNNGHLTYYINFFGNGNSNPHLSFIQEITCAMPIFSSLVKVLKVYINHLKQVSNSMQKLIKIIFFCLSAMTFENEKCCESFIEIPENLIWEFFEADSEFCIVLYNYICWNKNFIDNLFRQNSSSLKIITHLIKHIAKEKVIAVKSFCLGILLKLFSIKNLKKYKRTMRQLFFYAYLKLKELLIENLISLNKSYLKIYANFEPGILNIHKKNVKMIDNKICLSLNMISFLIKISKDKINLSKIVVQQFFSLRFISKVIRSDFVWFYAKHKHLKIISKIYSLKDSQTSIYFHEILKEIWIPLVDLFISKIGNLQENKIQYISFNYLLTTKSATYVEMKTKYLLEIIKIIFNIIKTFYEVKFKGVDTFIFFQGLKKLIEFFCGYNDFNILKTEFENITDYLIENWKSGKIKGQSEIEQLLENKVFHNGKEQSEHSKVNLREHAEPEIGQLPNSTFSQKLPILKAGTMFITNQSFAVRRSKSDSFNLPEKFNPFSENSLGFQYAPVQRSNKIRISFSIEKDTQDYINADYKLIYLFLDNFKMSKTAESVKLHFLKNIIDGLRTSCFRKNASAEIIKSLKLLRHHVENEVPTEIESFQWTNGPFRKYNQRIILRQNELIELKVSDLLIYLVENEAVKIKIFNETLKLGIAILFGGNKKAQDSFLSELTANPNSSFLQTIHEIIDEHVETLRPRFEEYYMHYIRNFIEANYKSFKDTKERQTSKKIETLNLIFRFLQLLCEGHNREMQIFLLDQSLLANRDGAKTFNFIELALNALGVMVKFLNPSSIYNCEQILDFLIESVQGPCAETQAFLLKSRLIDYANYAFLELFNEVKSDIKGFYNSQNIQQINIFVMKFVRLFMSLLEADDNFQARDLFKKSLEFDYLANHIKKGLREWLVKNFGRTSSYARELIGKFDCNRPQEFFESYGKSLSFMNSKLYKKSGTANKKQSEPIFENEINISDLLQMFNFMTFDEEISSLFEVYILLKNLLKKSEIKLLDPENGIFISFFSHFTQKIQICFKGKIYKNYFIIHPCCFYIEKSLLNRMIKGINRSTPIHKVSDLVDLSFKFFLEIEQQFFLNSKLKRFGINSTVFTLTKKMVTFFGVAINFLILFTFEKKVENSQIVNEIQYSINYLLILFGGYIILILLILKIILYFVFRGQTKFFLHMTRYEILVQSAWVNPDEFKNMIDLQFEQKNQKAKVLKVLSRYLEFHNPNISPLFFYRYKQVEFFLKDATIVNSIFFFTLVALAVFMQFTFLYAFLLLDLVQYFAVLRNIFKAISKNSQLLFLTLFLILLIVFIYSVFAYTFLNPDFYMNDPGESSCESIFHCFLTIINFGPRSTGSIGDVIQWPSFGNRAHYFVRWFFDFSIWALVNLILQNILLVIIVDTFIELDEQKMKIADDIQNSCSICSINKTVFDKYTKGFKHHINFEHKIEHYIYFIYYLKQKGESELTGIEDYIKSCIRCKNVSWIPIMRAKSLENVSVNLDNQKTNIS